MPTDIVESNHPKQTLLFYVAQDLTPLIRQQVYQLLQSLEHTREWVIGPPELVNAVELSENPDADEPIETVGGRLQIYAATRPGGLPVPIDRQRFEEVEALVKAVREFSAASAILFELELDGNYVGAVDNGQMDQSLQVGLLDSWRQQLDATE